MQSYVSLAVLLQMCACALSPAAAAAEEDAIPEADQILTNFRPLPTLLYLHSPLAVAADILTDVLFLLQFN